VPRFIGAFASGTGSRGADCVGAAASSGGWAARILTDRLIDAADTPLKTAERSVRRWAGVSPGLTFVRAFTCSPTIRNLSPPKDR